MFFDWFKKKQKSCLGIDFGSSSIKVVELSRGDKDRLSLDNYVIAQTPIGSRLNFARLESQQIADLLERLFEKAEIKTRRAVISLSVGETFSTIITLPSMPEEELAKAIPFQARKYVPIPIEEVVLDWSVVGEFVSNQAAAADSATGAPKPQDGQKQEAPPGAAKTIQVLIVAVPQEVIRRIAQIAKSMKLEVLAVEQEAFSIVRALIGKDEGGYLVVDLGQENIDFIIVDKNSIRLTCTYENSQVLDLAAEARKTISAYQARYQRKISGVILSGGGVTQSGAKEIFGQSLGISVSVGDPFARLAHDPKLDVTLKELAPFTAVAVGGAMREI